MRHRVMVVLALCFVLAGGAVALVDQVILPNHANGTRYDPFAGTYLERLGTTPGAKPPYITIDVLVYPHYVRYGLFVGPGVYELSFAEAQRAPATVKGDCPHSKIAVVSHSGSRNVAWRLDGSLVAPATDSTIKHYWMFYWDVPRQSVRSGIGQVRIPVYPASDTSAAFDTLAGDKPTPITNAQINVYLREKGASFKEAGGAGFDTGNYIHLSEDLTDAQPQWITIETGWLSFVASISLAVLFLGAGMLLGSIEWGHVFRRGGTSTPTRSPGAP